MYTDSKCGILMHATEGSYQTGHLFRKYTILWEILIKAR